LDKINHNHAMHGEQCGVGTILCSYLYRSNWQRIKTTLKKLGAPTSAKELSAEDQDVVRAFEMAATIRPERYTILQKMNLNLESCERIAKATGVIC
jgi:glycerol-1-phosphate dehydrogenase [NAD(P)+]